MLFPIGVTPPPRRFAWANATLMAINVAVFLLISLPLSMQAVNPDDPGTQDYLMEMYHVTGRHPLAIAAHSSAYDVFIYENGYRPAAPDAGSLFFAMFLHAGLAHLVGNMLFLGIFGGHVEERLGPLR